MLVVFVHMFIWCRLVAFVDILPWYRLVAFVDMVTWCRLEAFVEMFTWCMGDFKMWYGHVSPWLLSCVLYVLHIVVIMLSKYCQGAAENLNIFSTSNLNWNNCKLCQIYLSKYKCIIPKLGVKSQIGLTNRGKIRRAFLSFYTKFNTVRGGWQNRGKVLLRFEIIGVNSQSKKNRGKITISKQNRGKSAGAPK